VHAITSTTLDHPSLAHPTNLAGARHLSIVTSTVLRMFAGRRSVLIAARSGCGLVRLRGRFSGRFSRRPTAVSGGYRLHTQGPQRLFLSPLIATACSTAHPETVRRFRPLKRQPTGSPALAFQREPCGVVHRQGRLVFALDSAVFCSCHRVLRVVRRAKTTDLSLPDQVPPRPRARSLEPVSHG